MACSISIATLLTRCVCVWGGFSSVGRGHKASAWLVLSPGACKSTERKDMFWHRSLFWKHSLIFPIFPKGIAGKNSGTWPVTPWPAAPALFGGGGWLSWQEGAGPQKALPKDGLAWAFLVGQALHLWAQEALLLLEGKPGEVGPQWPPWLARGVWLEAQGSHWPPLRGCSMGGWGGECAEEMEGISGGGVFPGQPKGHLSGRVLMHK